MRNRILSVMAIIVMCMVTLMGCNNIEFDQTTNKNDLLTEEYSLAQINELKSAAESGEVTFSKFKRDFKVQCARKTQPGYYVVLLLEDGGNAFVFFNDENVLIRVLAVSSFITKAEFQKHVVKGTPESEVRNFDPNTIDAPLSGPHVTDHIVQEGIFTVMYDYRLEGEPIVRSVNFFDNAYLTANQDLCASAGFPFVFEFDKVSD